MGRTYPFPTKIRITPTSRPSQGVFRALRLSPGSALVPCLGKSPKIAMSARHSSMSSRIRCMSAWSCLWDSSLLTLDSGVAQCVTAGSKRPPLCTASMFLRWRMLLKIRRFIHRELWINLVILLAKPPHGLRRTLCRVYDQPFSAVTPLTARHVPYGKHPFESPYRLNSPTP